MHIPGNDFQSTCVRFIDTLTYFFKYTHCNIFGCRFRE